MYTFVVPLKSSSPATAMEGWIVDCGDVWVELENGLRRQWSPELASDLTFRSRRQNESGLKK